MSTQPNNNDIKFLPTHGNYRSYYGYRRKKSLAIPKVAVSSSSSSSSTCTFSSVETLCIDPRLMNIAEKGFQFQGKHVLDIGCNDGTVTLEIG